jgi:hypothetical protein
MVRLVNASGVELRAGSTEVAHCKQFDLTSFVSPSAGWRPPYPYRCTDVLLDPGKNVKNEQSNNMVQEKEMMDLPMNANVHCADGHGGHSTYVIVNPVDQQVTHLVVKEHKPPFIERLVPIDQVVETTSNLIRLRCTQDELEKMEPFIETEYLVANIPNYEVLRGIYRVWPFVVPEETRYIPLEHEHIPPGELAVHRGAWVEATDGRVGQVDEFLVDPKNGHITHLVLREGHLWGRKDVVIPVSAIVRSEEDAVYLGLDKRSIEALPTIPVRRLAMW